MRQMDILMVLKNVAYEINHIPGMMSQVIEPLSHRPDF